MHDSRGALLPVQGAADIHQAARVGAHERVGLCIGHTGRFVGDHGSRDFRIPHCERSTETAALVLAFERHIFDSLNGANQDLRLVFQAESAQVASIMIRHLPLEPGPHVTHFQPVDQKIA